LLGFGAPGIADDLHIMLTCYMRAQVFHCGHSSLFYSAALLPLGFPHAIVLGVLGGVLEFIWQCL
jgi:predicted PurR-regulated permease PerM